MFDTVAPRQSQAIQVQPRRHHGAPSARHTLEEAYEARLLGEVARWDDQAAFESIYAPHIAAVTRAAMDICQDAGVAEDIAQQTFTALWIRAERLAAKSLRLRPWLCAVARNAAIDQVRTGSAMVISLDDAGDAVSREPAPEESVLAGKSMDELRRALAALSPEHRAAVEMVYFAGMTYQSAAAATGQSAGSIKSRVRLAIAQLCAALGVPQH